MSIIIKIFIEFAGLILALAAGLYFIDIKIKKEFLKRLLGAILTVIVVALVAMAIGGNCCNVFSQPK